MSKPSSSSTAYQMEPQQLHAEYDDIDPSRYHRDSRLTFATAALAFRDALDNSRRKKTAQATVVEREVKDVPKTPEALETKTTLGMR